MKMQIHVQASVLRSLSLPHFKAAKLFSRTVESIENEIKGKQTGQFFEDIFPHASACVFMCVASMEAYANESIYWKKQDNAQCIPPQAEALWECIDKMNLLEKFSTLLALEASSRFNKGESVYDNVSTLIALRNALVHFKPEFDTEADKHETLSRKLAGKFAPSPFLINEPLLFPIKWASSSATKWTLVSCAKFLTEFERLANFSSSPRARASKFQEIAIS